MMVTTGGRGLQVVVHSRRRRRGPLPRRIRQRASPCVRALRRSAGRVSESITSVILCICPCFISILITSTARSDMRLASSWMVMVSGMITSRAIFSFCSTWRWPVRRWLRRRNDATERVRSSSPEVAAVTVRRPRRFSSPGAALGALRTVAGLAATPGRRIVRAPSSSSMVAGRAATGAAERVFGFAVVGSGATGGPGGPCG